MNIEQLERIIDRYLAGLASEEEKTFIARWLESRPEDIRSLEAPQKETIRTALWQSVAQATGAENETGARRRFLQGRTWLRYAAAAIILLTGSLFFYNVSQKKQNPTAQVFTIERGANKTFKTFVLPDSSVVRLFPGASLTIPEDYNENERNIALTGRGFFEVRPDMDRPFYVQAGKLRTRVLGTSFEVMATGSIHSSITVRTGKVGVQYGDRQLADLTAGKRLRYNELQNDFEIDEVDAGTLCEWWNNGMIFRQAPLEEVMHNLSDWYNVPITITGDKWKQETVTVRVKDQSLEETVSLLSQTLGFRYRQEGGKILIY